MPTRLEMVWKHVRGLPRPEFDQNALHGSRLWIVELVVVVLSRGSPNGGGGPWSATHLKHDVLIDLGLEGPSGCHHVRLCPSFAKNRRQLLH